VFSEISYSVDGEVPDFAVEWKDDEDDEEEVDYQSRQVWSLGS
jgi:hypothetical protein